MRSLFALLLLLASSGCATIFNTPVDRVEVTSDPPGAHVEITPMGRAVSVDTTRGEYVYKGTTPFEARLSRKGDVAIQFTKEGYEPERVILRRGTSPLLIPSFLMGVVPVVFDAITGGLYTFPEEEGAALKKAELTER